MQSIREKLSSRSFGYFLLTLLYLVFIAYALKHRALPLSDDTAIFFRYADNIAHGYGIVYNPHGPRVYGSSSLPYNFLLALLYRCGIGLSLSSLIINVMSVGVALYWLYTMSVDQGDGKKPALTPLFALMPCAFALFHGRSIVWITQGMEVGFHLALCTAAIWAYHRRKEVLCGFFLGLALMNKLDAVSLVAAILIVSIAHHRRAPWRIIVVTALTYLPWVIFTKLYFGSPIPMSLQAKQIHEFAKAGHEFLRYYWNYSYVVLPGLCAVFFFRRSFIQILTIWLLLYIGLYDHVSRSYPFPWYFFVSDFVVWYLAGTILAYLFQTSGYLKREEKENSAPIIQGLFIPANRFPYLLVAGLVLILLLRQDVRDSKVQIVIAQQYAHTVEADRVDIGNWVHRYADPKESIFTGHGWIQYLSGLTVYDASGINDPELTKMSRENHLTDYLVERRPSYLVNHAYIPPAEMRNDYVLLAHFNRSHLHGVPDWSLWGRKDSAAVRKLQGVKLPLIYPAGSLYTPNPVPL